MCNLQVLHLAAQASVKALVPLNLFLATKSEEAIT